MNYEMLGFEIEGSPVVKMYDDGTLQTEDSRLWYWVDSSYQDSDSGRMVPEGEWLEYIEQGGN